MFTSTIARGLAAGAAGVTALNAITYADMALRARPSSDTPQQAVAALADKAGVTIPGAGPERENRLAGLGPLSGIATGGGVGAVAALLRPLLRRLPAPLAMVVLGAAAMLASDGPLVALGLAQPRDWSAVDWLSDIVPHLGYGAVTYAVLDDLQGW
ncbi:MAG: hypothetical protein M3O28_01155 [Actinomycetota bacterium]|nr:hypothetical protein [Actinomycetota bacterium]